MMVPVYLLAFVVLNLLLLKVSEDGNKRYGLFFFRSSSFVALTLGAIIGPVVGTYNIGATSVYWKNIAMWVNWEMIVISLVSVAIAVRINIKNSDKTYGFFYTFAQAITAYFLIGSLFFAGGALYGISGIYNYDKSFNCYWIFNCSE